MKVFVAGAAGAIGRPLIKSLTLPGHTTFGMVRSQSSSASISDSGAEPVIADALDGALGILIFRSITKVTLQ